MRQHLTIGLLQEQAGWRILLRQIGVAFERIDALSSVVPDMYSVIIVNRWLNPAETADVLRFVRAGGAVLDAGGYFSKRARQDSVHLDEIENGSVATLGLNIHRLVTDTHSRRKRFSTPFGKFPDEVVARVSKGEIRRIIETLLRTLHHRRGLPFIYLWRFPGRLPSVFCYRIDSDYGTRDQVMALYETARHYDIRMTWFLHVQAHEQWLSLFREFHDQEMAVHCYRHRTFRKFETNYANIGEAMFLLRENGIEYSGFSAPNGMWNIPLAHAVEQHGFDYSSEFALDYDDLPFFPWLQYRFSATLQVPVHPVCIGSLARAQTSPESMKQYFRWMMDLKLRNNEPVIFYHHPGHEHADVMADTFSCVRERDIHNMTFGEYAAWWRTRAGARYSVTFDGNSFEVRSENRAADVCIAADFPDGRRTFIERDGIVNMNTLEWESGTREHPVLPNTLRDVYPFSLRTLQHSIEDFNYRIRQ